MFEDIQKHRQAVAENIEKSLQIGYTESEDFEKAHNVGDVHPNGKWVWTKLPSGKYDWRVIKKTAQGAGNTTTQSNNAPKSSVNGAKTFDDVLAEYKNGGNAVQTFDGKAYNLLEYENQKKMALQVDAKARSFGKHVAENNVKETLKKIEDTKKNHPGAHATMAKLNQDLAKFNSQVKAIEDAEKETAKKPKSKKQLLEDYKAYIESLTSKNGNPYKENINYIVYEYDKEPIEDENGDWEKDGNVFDPEHPYNFDVEEVESFDSLADAKKYAKKNGNYYKGYGVACEIYIQEYDEKKGYFGDEELDHAVSATPEGARMKLIKYLGIDK